MTSPPRVILSPNGVAERIFSQALSGHPLGGKKMPQASSQAAAFYREVAETRRLWTVKDSSGYPAPRNSSGERAQPFWSSLARVRKIISTSPAYQEFEPHEISWSDFCERWAPGLTRDRILMGVNWTGVSATGFDVPPAEVVANVTAAISGVH